jgi:hypothetical protein
VEDIVGDDFEESTRRKRSTWERRRKFADDR